jgi:hypothetical protein
LAAAVTERIKTECPGVVWKESFAILGRLDVVDIVQAADPNEEKEMIDHPRLRTFDHQNPDCHALEGILLTCCKKLERSHS